MKKIGKILRLGFADWGRREMAELDFAQIANWLGSRSEVSKRVLGFRQDSRAVVPGDLFFAIKGEKVDGHSYLGQAASKGAVGAVVSQDYRGQDFGLALVRVESVLGGLHQLAKTVHGLRKVRVVGVTGSVGKTLTKEFIATLLELKFRVGKTPGNANSQVGFPLSILNSSGQEEIFVMEMGMSLPDEMDRLVAIAPPEIAIVTKIAPAHVGNFSEGLEAIAKEKAKIFSHPLTQCAILNQQVLSFEPMQKGNCLKITYGLEAESIDSDFVLCKEGVDYFIREKGQRRLSFSLPFVASHLCENFLGAAAVARQLGMQWSEIVLQAQKLKVFKRRFERIERCGVVFIDDSYNANVTSMRAALENFPLPMPGKRRIALLGAMAELGRHRIEAHLEVANAALEVVDHLLCLGRDTLEMVDVFKAAKRPVEYFEDLEEVKKRVFALAQEGDVVLLKGANSAGLWRILDSN